MTVNRLHQMLTSLIAEGHGRKTVTINKKTFTHPLEPDGCCILKVCGGDIQWVPTADDDGGTKINKDGTESGRTHFVMFGNNAE